MSRAFNLLASLLPQASQAELEFLKYSFQHLHKKVWSKDHYLFRQGESWHQLILIEKGLIRCFYLEDGRDINLRFLCGESIALPFASLADHFINPQAGLIASEYIQTVSEVHGYCIPLEFLLDQVKYPILDRLRIEIIARHYIAIEQRLRMIQNLRAIERYKKFLAWMPADIVQNMPNHHIASYLGIAPESLSRLKQNFYYEN
ncbi:Crp/Fnr family transcriptional regulator [Acinetobacter puyangensis]|uniref:cAMP-binding domain of CRP or a regulatory subunit of cAMP-dependent protein kinases n=1 Tax=Acinetobacter puyangensis TaxID=1096779 RepID=A0A240E4K2_9GAMM|nr:Crp/Fnr family transcriptional regulator [Acinetobacter puyangensis]SNX43129.1 cAMP-binding domain of CRP or a regulatory subunit of cAMP-dependent protein kinases [Acinetobacter puyangensis]